jgi:hypothetical protein
LQGISNIDTCKKACPTLSPPFDLDRTRGRISIRVTSRFVMQYHHHQEAIVIDETLFIKNWVLKKKRKKKHLQKGKKFIISKN